MPRIDYEKLLQSVSIEDVAKRLGMSLQETGHNQSKALCPFHNDKSPSLLVDSSRDKGRQHYYCFSCGAHGDVIDLVKEKLNLNFKEAVEWLSPGSNASIGSKNYTAADHSKNSSVLNHSALEFGFSLYKKGKNETNFHSWVLERNLDPVVLQRAGFIFASRNFLSRKLDAERDLSNRREYAGDLEDAFLVRKIIPGPSADLHLPLNGGREGINRYSDFFIGERIIFPIRDEQGKLLGLAGRAVGEISGTSIPKYQFTRGCPKSSVLYRADYAFKLVRNEAKKGNKNVQLFLCEGFLDALRFESLGMPAVAVMGSSVSEQQVRLLRRLSDDLPKDATLTVVISFDRDEAGLRGAADACLKLIHAPVECAFLWPTTQQLQAIGSVHLNNKDPNDYLQNLSVEVVNQLKSIATYPPVLAIIANAFGVSAEDSLCQNIWGSSSRTRRLRAFNRAANQLKSAVGGSSDNLREKLTPISTTSLDLPVLAEWLDYLRESASDVHRALSEDFLNNAQARLNHSRILAYMGSRRGELPCDEPRWERLDIAATVFNALLTDRLGSNQISGPIGPYNAVWVPRTFGGNDPRLKIMPRPEDLIIQQYLLNEILTERWDHKAFSNASFSRFVPAVRYYREGRKTITTGFDSNGDGRGGELSSQTLSFAYQIDMDVLEGRQPATDQGMYRPFHECWHDFMKSLTKQATEIGFVYSIRLDVQRYYDQLRRYVVRDRLLEPLKSALESVSDLSPEFAGLLCFEDRASSADKAASVLDHLDEYLFGVGYSSPDSGLEVKTDVFMGIPQGPVLSAWIGSVALFPADEEAHRFMNRLNADRVRVGYARYVDDIVLLADDPATLAEMREAIDSRVRKMELTLLAKADEIPAMSAEDFTSYINQGRALAASGLAWEPPLVGDGEPGWEFWSVATTTDRQSALQLLHNVELYKASKLTLLQTVKTSLSAPDLRTSELPKAARLIWYSIAVERFEGGDSNNIWSQYLEVWNRCMQNAAWSLQPDKFAWESPVLFALEGLEHLIDKQDRDVAVLTAKENIERRGRILWLAEQVLTSNFDLCAFNLTPCPKHQIEVRLALVRWKAMQLTGKVRPKPETQLLAERSRLVRDWKPFDWMHDAVSLLSGSNPSGVDPLMPFVEPIKMHKRIGAQLSGTAMDIFDALLPVEERLASEDISDKKPKFSPLVLSIALQTLVSVVPKELLLNCLGHRSHLIWKATSDRDNLVTFPPLPGISTSRLFSFSGAETDNQGFILVSGIEAIDFASSGENGDFPVFFGSESGNSDLALKMEWQSEPLVDGLIRLKATLGTEDCLILRERAPAVAGDISPDVLRHAAMLYRAMARIVTTYSKEHEDKELVPAWPYIAKWENSQFYYLVAEGVSRGELGNRAFVRDGGRSLRTAEIPIYEANLWRVGVAISDYLGLYDDCAKFSNPDMDVGLDAQALANPARYVLRTQLRKLRGAYADSGISKRRSPDGVLPATVERSLHLLETFPESPTDPLDSLFYVLAAEAESAGMYLALRESWCSGEASAFLKALTNRVVGRLPLSINDVLAINNENHNGVRRDLAGLVCFARRLFLAQDNCAVSNQLSWKVLRAGSISTAIYVALDGLIASLRSHGSFERFESFDFPAEWEIPVVSYPIEEQEDNIDFKGSGKTRISLIELYRRLVQHLGHRLNRENLDCLPITLYKQMCSIAKNIALIDSQGGENESPFEWPFEILNENCVSLLTLELLESVSNLVTLIDEELGFEPILVMEKSYGYSPQTKRFTDSRSGVRDVTPWMISQFPHSAKNIEEISLGGSFLRVWTEVFDRKSGTLLSVSALGEPFASIAISKQSLDIPVIDVVSSPQERSLLTSDQQAELTQLEVLDQGKDTHASNLELDTPLDVDSQQALPSQKKVELATFKEPAEGALLRNANAFRKQQQNQWSRRGEGLKSSGHIRVALLQANFDLTYKHPFVEACPTNWPFSFHDKVHITEQLKLSEDYKLLLSMKENSEKAHLLNNIGSLPSWSEHRRQSILRRVIDSCEVFGVDLLVLPEYSVRRETIDWLKGYLANKGVSVLAGTYMNTELEPSNNHLAAPLTLLWPLPKRVSNLFGAELKEKGLGSENDYDLLHQGHVIEFSRNKKYRSIALDEFFRPSTLPLKALFNLSELKKELERKVGFAPSGDLISFLLAETRLPLKYFLELICSEIFLVSSPANYVHMARDLKAMQQRFGNSANEDDVFTDLKFLSNALSITGGGTDPRRSILAVPAATSRSADYWIAGQASFLAAGTITVFCNSTEGRTLVGGSCFIGCGSWKSDDAAHGYISKITPYHGWSKGIYYNNKNDALSQKDQALVIADIDPHNMLEGKPRAQTMPAPLQLVAYLPLVESIDWSLTKKSLLTKLGITCSEDKGDKDATRPQDEAKFWGVVDNAKVLKSEDQLNELWKMFSDSSSLTSRAKAYWHNGNMQPTSAMGTSGMFASPALYDWIDISLTLTAQQELPLVKITPWVFR